MTTLVEAQTDSVLRLEDRYSETLVGRIAAGWRLTSPITVTVERDENGGFLASEMVTTVYGYGQSGPSAIADYILSLIEYYEIVQASRAPESQALAAVLARYLTTI